MSSWQNSLTLGFTRCYPSFEFMARIEAPRTKGSSNRGSGVFSRVVLGLVVAATGVGAGDLITASLAGSKVGLALLWAALAGAVLKWALNEGIARWQMATGATLLEGWVEHLGAAVHWIFFAYFLIWSYVVAGALINACGVAGAGLLPLGDPGTSRIVWGVLHSLVGLALVWAGGFKVFQYLMAGLIVIMVGAVLLTVVLIRPDWPAVARGLFIPSLPAGGTAWLLAVLGGVGGTVTLLCYSYWIREKGRTGRAGVRESRFDLTVAYGLTAFFGAAMIVIGSRVEVGGRGDTVAIVLADQLGRVLGPFGRGLFLFGFWGAVFSSLLGVWQGVPYMFADFLGLRRRGKEGGGAARALARTRPYRAYLIALATLPLTLLWFKVQEVQLVYGVIGALFMPFTALTLLILNNRVRLVGREFRNGLVVNLLLVLTLAFFIFVGAKEVLEFLG
jgi:Mn2+/Fe2+ NRAMP family transporter